ncbi:uncharacterized protein LOC105444787 [Strongylocentrotus purpuratus]|uniref:Sp185/333 n=1 Tax=Strongylocentrotus purpuratus TaxID=7668 RepID=A0A7M7HP32_STRPU|nr:uncharacterized protein LOC105444787 [Strongylocentrotus purpuratus]
MRQTLIILLVLAVIGAALVDAGSDFKRRRMTQATRRRMTQATRRRMPQATRRRMSQGTVGKGENEIPQHQKPNGYLQGPGKNTKNATSWKGEPLRVKEGRQTPEA